MNLAGWRERLKSGSLSGVYALARNGKRRMLRQPLVGSVPLTFAPLSVEELLGCGPRMRDHGRFYYSLGLAYLERGQPHDESRATACLRSAETLGFESRERVAIHLARLADKRGAVREAATLVAGIEPFELTANEVSLLQRIRARARVAVPSAHSYDSQLDREHFLLENSGIVSSLLVVGDLDAATATWCPPARYLSATPEVTGLEPEVVVSLGLVFDVVVGPPGAVEVARAAGVRCSRWHPLDNGRGAFAGLVRG